MTDRQFLLDLAAARNMRRGDFLPAPSNAAGLAAIDSWQGWPDGRMLICGPGGSGRSHLLTIWAAETGAVTLNGAELALPGPAPAYAIDDAAAVAGDARREEALFHLLNRARADAAPVLLTAPATPGTWRLVLPDLESRLLATAITRIGHPDPALVEMVLVKLFDDRQLLVGADTVAYLARRLDRSLAEASRVADALDREAVSRQKRVSRAFAAAVLRRLSAAPDP